MGYLTVCHGKSPFLIGKPSISIGFPMFFPHPHDLRRFARSRCGVRTQRAQRGAALQHRTGWGFGLAPPKGKIAAAGPEEKLQ